MTMSYFHTAGLLGAVALVIAGSGFLTRMNAKHGWSKALKERMGETAGNWVMRLSFIAALALIAGGLQRFGVVLPPELEQFIPSQVTTILAAIASAATYMLAPTKQQNGE